MGHPECPSQGLALGASSVLGWVMGGTDQLPQCHWAGSPVGVSLGRGRANSHRDLAAVPSCRIAGRASGSFAGADPWLQHSSPRFRGTQKAAGVMLSPGVLPSLGVPSTPQPQLELHSDLTRFSSIIQILESPGRNYRKLRLFQTLSARQVKSSHTKQGNQNLQH